MQLAVEPEPLTLQLDELKTPLPLLVQLTVPFGVTGVPGEVSVNVALHENMLG